MATNTGIDWPYPGSRWWKFDFHCHTPVSQDSRWARHNTDFSPEDWLLRYMAAEIDCVAITDHNSGAWIDELKSAYADMQAQSDADAAPEGFRELALFPGVEISVQGGLHLLAILDPTATKSDVDTLLGRVDYDGTRGDSDGVTRKGAAEVVNEVLEFGGIPIPAHVDGPKGLLEVRKDDPQSLRLDANSVKQVLDEHGILAMEVVDRTKAKHAIYRDRNLAWSEVLGSDSHNFHGSHFPGSRYTWVKMATPSLEGLRLALLDGNDISLRRSDDEGDFEPFKTPSIFISRIDVKSARFMGNGAPGTLEFTPFYNALVGGRGTGKSTIVQALRLAYRRDEDMKRFREGAELRRQFERFARVFRSRDGDGALRENTEILVTLMREGMEHRLRWRQDGRGDVVEEKNSKGQWQTSASGAITAGRFPIRLLSQGQIAAMAADNRQALLDIIDEAADVGELRNALEEELREYLSLCARLRVLEGRVAGRPELQRKLGDVNRQLEAFTQSQHADVLRAHQRAERQRREIDETLAQLRAVPQRIEALAQELLLDDWPGAIFDDGEDADILAWRAETEQVLSEARQTLRRAAGQLSARTSSLASDVRLTQWRQRSGEARRNYEELQARLAEQGVSDPQAFGRLVQSRQQFEAQARELDQL
ncbi:MAG: chromosome segregation protein SMC, partial [Gemmatimonadetes bacterium]|nr:chromosome segregation protein SMC [Gemmatimonadota bacterium]